MGLIRLSLFAALCLASHLALAGEVRELHPGQWNALTTQGKPPLLVTFWSASCAHCPEELKSLGELRRRYPNFQVILVATDTPREIPLLQQLAEKYGLSDVPQWVFADVAPERLRFEIDRQWYGELPRTLFIERQGSRHAVSGVVPAAQLEAWAKSGRYSAGKTQPRPAQHSH